MKKIKNIKSYMLFGLPVFLMPMVVFGQDTSAIDTLLESVLTIVDTLALIVMGLAFLFFLWGLALFILKAGDEAERSKGKNIMFWGIIAFLVMVSLWGIVSWLQTLFGVGNGDDIGVPRRPWQQEQSGD